MKREWRSYGWYTSCEEMDEVRRREKVSKRKSVTSVHGTKVFYRCNNWRRTRCNFRMYAIIFTSNKMCLFASGEHDHTTKDPYYITGITSRTRFFLENFVFTMSSMIVIFELINLSKTGVYRLLNCTEHKTMSSKNLLSVYRQKQYCFMVGYGNG